MIGRVGDTLILGPDGRPFEVRAIPYGGVIGDPAFWREGLLSRSATDTIARPYEQSEWIFACVSLVAETLAATPLRVYRGSRRDVEPVESGPVFDLFENPHPDMSPIEFWAQVAAWMLLRGEAFAVPYVGGKPLTGTKPKLPDSWEMAAPSSVTEKEDPETGQLVRWDIEVGASRSKLAIPKALMVHPKRFTPYNRWRGIGPLAVAAINADMAYKAVLWNAAFLANNADPGGIIKLQRQADQTIITRLKAEWTEDHGGPRKAGKPRVLDQGSEYVPHVVDHSKMQFIAALEWARDAICAAFRVPKALLSVTDDINYATSLTQERALIIHGVRPVGALIASAFNRFLAMAGLKEWIWFDDSGNEALQEGKRTQLGSMAVLQGAGYTANEAAEFLDLDLPRDAAWRDEAWTAPTMTTFSAIMDAEEQADEAINAAIAGNQEPPTAPQSKPEPDTEDDTDDEPAMRRAVIKGIRRRLANIEAKERLATYQREILFPLEGRILRLYNAFLRRQRKEVLRRLRATEAGRSMSRALTAEDIDQLVLYSWEQWDRVLADVLSEPFWDVMAASGKQLGQEIGVSFALDRNDPRMLSLFRDKIATLVKTNATTREAVRDALIRGVADSKPLRELIDSIKGLPEFSPARGLTVARTETGFLSNGTRFEVMAAEGIERHRWVTALDDVVRESHADIDGEVVAIGERFGNGLRHPHEIGAPAGEVINCRCDAVADL